MWNSVANLKENLHKIVLDVHDDNEDEDADDYEIRAKINGDRHLPSVSSKRSSRRFSHSDASFHSPVANGITSPHSPEENTVSLDEKNESLAALQANHELQMKQMRIELENERGKFGNSQRQLQEEHKLNESMREDIKSLSMEKNKISSECSKLRSELEGNITEVTLLQMDLQKHNFQDSDSVVDNPKRVIRTLEMENTTLKSSVCNSEKEEMEQLENDLKEARNERDKAVQQLNRLKQHLLEKESEESEKMDEDNKLIEELRRTVEYQQGQILHLEISIKQVIASRDELKMNNNMELQNAKEAIEDLNRKLASCISTIEIKNVELRNLQTVLGQYSAEIEAMERLERDLISSREQSAKLSEQLKNEIAKGEKEQLLNQIAQTERMYEEGKKRVNKLEEDNEKLRHALEQSMTRLNMMSMDSDFFVDRRIVIKLLVTYFQRNHNKEDTHYQNEIAKGEKEQLLNQIAQTEWMYEEGKKRVNKLEEDNEKLRHALEQSMTRLNRMSMDSDFFVDRRIVIKLLVTYFQRNHNKEVLNLMVPMIGFS